MRPPTLIAALLILSPSLLAPRDAAADAPATEAAAFGCVADYERIRCSVAGDGRVTRLAESGARPFVAGDVGKILIVAAARSWPLYSTEPVPLNARITDVDGRGVATVANVDGEGRGTPVACADTTAEFFTDNTDAIAAALAARAEAGAAHVRLPAGDVGLCPFASKTWAARPVLDAHTQARAVFVLGDGDHLKGGGRGRTRLKIGYFGEFEPYSSDGRPKFRHAPRLFLVRPQDGRTVRCTLEGFSVEFPFGPAVMSGYLFFTDTWNTVPPRHAVHATLRDLAVVDPARNTQTLDSSFGGIYGPDGRVLAESLYRIEDCEFETGGGCSVKNQNDLGPDRGGGKQVHLRNVVFRGGGNIATRHLLESARVEKTSDGAYLNVDTPGFSWHDFNAHSDQSDGPWQPWCRLRRAWAGTIGAARELPDGRIELTVRGPAAPVTKVGCDLLINFGRGDEQVYLPRSCEIAAGTGTVLLRPHPHFGAAEAVALRGSAVRVYHESHAVRGLKAGLTPRRIRLDPETARSLPDGGGLWDLTVNAPDLTPGAFGHTFYVGENVGFRVDGMKIHDCAKRSFRVSSGGSSAKAGVHDLTGYEALPARGAAAFCNDATEHQPLEEFGGLLTLTRSRAASVYPVRLLMSEGSAYVAHGGILGPSVVRDSRVGGTLGGRLEATNSEVNLTLSRLDGEGNRANGGLVDARTPELVLDGCRGAVTLQNGRLRAGRSELRVGFHGTSAEYDVWKATLGGRFDGCRLTGPFAGLHELTPEQRADFAARLGLTTGGAPAE